MAGASPLSFSGLVALAATFLVAGAVVVTGVSPLLGAGAFAAAMFAVFLWCVGLRWDVLLVALILLIWLVPIRRYALPVELPFELEPYRLMAACVIGGWGTSLLIDGRIRLRRTGLGTPLSIVVFATFASVGANWGAISAAGRQADVVKALMFFVSFVLLLVCIRSVVQPDAIPTLVRALVIGGAVIGAATLIEARTLYNVFDHLAEFAPFLREVALLDVAADPTQFARSEYGRAYASAEHPIALGAALVLVMPLALHLIQHHRRRALWSLCLVLILLGSLASVSRTPVIMLGAGAVVYAILRTRAVLKLAPVIVPILLVVIHFALPTTLGTLKSSFLPEGGLIAQQQASKGTRAQGRIADLDPAFAEVKRRPLFGEGYSARAVDKNSLDPLQILDDQWLGILLSTGIVGFTGWLWLFVRFVRRTGRLARRDTPEGSLALALTASVGAAAVGMLTFDAFAFSQWLFVLFVVFGIGTTLIGEPALGAQPIESRRRSAAESFAGPVGEPA